MNMQTANQTGDQVISQLQIGDMEAAFSILAPILAERTPFRFLDRIGSTVGQCELDNLAAFLDRIAAANTEGGWPVIGSALRSQMKRDFSGSFANAHKYIIAADIWYGADILGERIPGPGLVTHFDEALKLLSPWRDDPNRWVRRAVGVSVHFWAKRSKGNPALDSQAFALLALLKPMFSEWEMDTVKGIGWGLKTMGRYYPDMLTTWLLKQAGRRHRAIMLDKATKFLSNEQRRAVNRKA